MFSSHPPIHSAHAAPCPPSRPRLHESIPSDRWPRSARKVKGHSIAGGHPTPTPRQVGSVHLASGGRKESIGAHLPGQFSPFSLQEEGRGMVGRKGGEREDMATKRWRSPPLAFSHAPEFPSRLRIFFPRWQEKATQEWSCSSEGLLPSQAADSPLNQRREG